MEEATNNNQKLAISHGSLALDIDSSPKTPAEALKLLLKMSPDRELIFIQLDNSVVVQTYAQIWERAEKILGGLQALGLQHGHPLILQVDTSPDFAPVLWSCIMGGFVPVPVPLASDYSKSNQSLSKLHKIWQQLDYPTILTTSKLASQIQTGLQLDELKDITIATIEEVEAHSPEPRLHKLQPHELVLLLPSSGTTGQPKLIEINCQTFIYRFLKNAINRKQDAPAKIFLSWFPLESISGILTTTPNGFQKNIYLPIEILIRNPLVWLDTLNKYRVTHAQTSNFILARITDQLRINAQGNWDFSSLQKIGIGAEPIVAKTARSFIQLLSPYNLHPNILYPAYGMTECGPIAGSSEGLSLTNTSDSDRFVEIGKPARGHSIRIVDQQGCILEEGQIGRIQVTGPSMTSGYYQAPELTRELFTEDGWINTGDLGFLQDGKLTVTGREKEIIIINARNYSCHEIELVAEEVEGVEPSYTAACAIRQSNSETDELVIFFHSLVSKESHLAQLLKQIRRKIADKLGINPTYLIPIEKSTIPRTATGKIQRLQLKQRLDAGEFEAICQQIEVLTNQERESNFVAPRENLELEVTKIWEQVLGKQSIGVRDNFFDLGGDSLLAVRLLAQIEKTFGKNLPLATLFQAPNIEELANILRQKGWSAPWQTLVAIQPGGSKPPLFCIHPVGGNVLCYQTLAHHLGQEQPVYGLQAVGLDGKQAPYKRAEDMAAHYIREIRAFQPEGPYLLAGHSSAGMVAFEIAQQLVAGGQKVAVLALLDAYSPQSLVRELPPGRTLYINFLNLLRLRPEDKLSYIKQRAVWLHGRITRKIAKTFNLWMRLPSTEDSHPYALITEAFNQAIRDYVPQVYPGQATLFRTRQQLTRVYYDPQFGWGSLVAGGLKIHDVPGFHLTMLTEPCVQVLGEKLRACIDEALEDVLEGNSSEPKKSITEVEYQTNFLNQERLSALQSSLVPIQPGDSKPPLFFIHVLGEGLKFCRPLTSHLDPEQPIYGLAVGIMDEVSLNKVDDVVAHYIKEMRSIQPEGPYLLAGIYCGGRVAYEVAQQLYAQGQKVALLALLDTLKDGEAIKIIPVKERALAHWNNFLRIGPAYLLSKRRLEKAKNRLMSIYCEFYERMGLPLPQASQSFTYQNKKEEGNKEWVFAPKQVYSGGVTLFRAIENIGFIDPDLGWSELAPGGLEIHDVPGDTFSMLQEPYVQGLAEKLRHCIDRVQAEELAHIPPLCSDPFVCDNEEAEG